MAETTFWGLETSMHALLCIYTISIHMREMGEQIMRFLVLMMNESSTRLR